MRTAYATGWPPPVVWDLTRMEIEEAGNAASRSSGQPYQRTMTSDEKAQKDAFKRAMRSSGVV